MNRWRLDILLLAMMAPAMFILSRHAKAAEVGQCFNVEQFNSTMRGEGQSSMAFANETQELPGTNLQRTWGWIFLKNATGREGYVVRTNADITQPFTEACVMQKLRNVSLDDARLSVVPPSALIPFTATRQTMNTVCEKEKADSICGFHNDVLSRWNAKGTRMIFHGTNIEGTLITLVGKSDGDRIGAMTETYHDSGILVANHQFATVGYSPKGAASLEGQK